MNQMSPTFQLFLTTVPIPYCPRFVIIAHNTKDSSLRQAPHPISVHLNKGVTFYSWMIYREYKHRRKKMRR